MSTQNKIAELKALAEALEQVAAAETVAAEAKSAYREDPSDENKAAHRAASQALNEARAATRGDENLRVVAPGDISLTPPTVGAGAEANAAVVKES